MPRSDEKMFNRYINHVRNNRQLVSEHHEKFDNSILLKTVGDLLDELESNSPDLYKELERYLENK